MMSQIKFGLILTLLLSAQKLDAQLAIEYAQGQGMMPLIQKGHSEQQQTPGALFYTDAFQPGPNDFHDPVWVEFVLNQIKLPALGGPWEVLGLIPENSEEVLVIVRREELLGYLRFIQIRESVEDP